MSLQEKLAVAQGKTVRHSLSQLCCKQELISEVMYRSKANLLKLHERTLSTCKRLRNPTLMLLQPNQTREWRPSCSLLAYLMHSAFTAMLRKEVGRM